MCSPGQSDVAAQCGSEAWCLSHQWIAGRVAATAEPPVRTLQHRSPGQVRSTGGNPAGRTATEDPATE